VLAAGVRVVGLQHLAHEQGGAAVGVAELERVLDALLAFAPEGGEQAHEGHREQDGLGRVLGDERDGEPERCERCVDDERDGLQAQLEVRRDAEREPVAKGSEGVVGHEARAESGEVHRPGGEGGLGGRRDGDHEGGADGVERVGE
jgi:hypothetical protein